MLNYRNTGMAECDNCGRKFFFEQFDKHRKNCELINGKLSKGTPKPSQSQKKLKIVKPKFIVCIICGRDYGSTSISIHGIQCQELFKKQQMVKPSSERKRLPVLSEEIKAQYDLKAIEEWSRKKIEEYNRIVLDIYNTKLLSKCYVCQRTFFEESLPKHLKDCQSKLTDVKKLVKFKQQICSNKDLFGDNFLENVMEMNRQLSSKTLKETKKPRVLMCLFCGRQYGATSLKIHIPRCRGHSIQKNIDLKETMELIRQKYTIEEADTWTDDQIEEYNSEVSELFKTKSLFDCKYCHRTFFQ